VRKGLTHEATVIVDKVCDVYAKMGSGASSEAVTGPGAEPSTNGEVKDRTEAVEALAVAIIKALRRHTSRCENEQKLIQKLAEDEVLFDLQDLPAALARLTTDSEFEGCMLPGYELTKLLRVRPRHHQLDRPWEPPGPDWAFVLADVRPW